VTAINGSKVSVDLGRSVGRFGRIVTGPASIFRKVEG
jgi:hypothetical protein